MLILGFESSCDETGVALVDASGSAVPRLLGHALHSQIEMHQGHTGFVTRRFESQNQHGGECTGATKYKG
jgi:tRNA A37 threonylcarbamoyltransferase TsaD